MNIGINLTKYSKGGTGGLGVYVKGLLHDFPKIKKENLYFVFCRERDYEEFSKFDVKVVTFENDLLDEKLFPLIKYEIDINKIDVWYCPLLNLEPLDISIPNLINIPDMQHEFYPRFFDPNVLQWRLENYKSSADKTDCVLTLSNASKNDITKYLKIDSNKVKTVYLSPPPWFKDGLENLDAKKLLDRFDLQKDKYLLYPANFWPHKNHKNLIEAFSLINKKHPQIKLVLTGNAFDKEIKKIVNKFKLKDNIVLTGYLEDVEMPHMFANALAMVYPSLFEGFGIPLLEAYRYECPVACSDLEVLKEIANDAALYFNPHDVNAIFNIVDRIISDKITRNNLIVKGKEILPRYSSVNTSIETLKVIEDIYNKNKNKQDYYNFDYSEITNWPKISIIVPSYQYGRFIKRAIDSILNQNYPNLEIIVMDGGSTDNTVEILKSYGDKIIWRSEKDGGQTDAINKGLKLATGDIVAYLNSDDSYIDGSLRFVAKYFIEHKDSYFLQGKGRYIDADDRFINDYINSKTDFNDLHGICRICQPACFWRREVVDKVGLFDENFDYAMDYEYWIRVTSQGYNLDYMPVYLANSRDHGDTKTNSQFLKVYKNIFEINKKYYKFVHRDWIIGYTITSNKILDEAYKRSVFTYLKTVLLCSINNYKVNSKFVDKNLLSVYATWGKSLVKNYIKKFKLLKSFIKKLINMGVRAYKYITSNDYLSYKLVYPFIKIFRIKLNRFERFAIIQQHAPKDIGYDLYTDSKVPLKNKFSIVTPTYNQGEFIERTIKSVISQGDNIEYIVQDSLSSDVTESVVTRYKNHLIYNREKDSGQADALNKGFSKTKGEIMAFINSDDIFLPNTFAIVDKFFEDNPHIDVVYGDRLIINDDDKEIGNWILPPFDPEPIKYTDYIPQETLFWRKSIWDKLGYGFDESYRFALDWDFIIRLIHAGAKFHHLPKYLGAFRYHELQKTSSIMHEIGYYEFDRVKLNSLGKLIPMRDTHHHNIAIRTKTSVYALLRKFGI